MRRTLVHHTWNPCAWRRPAYAAGYAHGRSHGRASATDREGLRNEGPRSAWFAETRSSRHHRGGRGDFGVRRPLRYLRYQLDLDDTQTRRAAAILNRLKLEREQAQLDEERGLQALADRVEAGETEQGNLQSVLDARVKSAEHMQHEVAAAVSALCEVLDEDQRLRLAELMRSGSIAW